MVQLSYFFPFLKSEVLNDIKQSQCHAVRMQHLITFYIQSKCQMPFTIPLFLNHENIFIFIIIITFKDVQNDLTPSSPEDSIK